MAFRFFNALPDKSWRSDLTTAQGKSGKPLPGLSGTPLGRPADRGQGGGVLAGRDGPVSTSASSSSLAPPSLRVASQASLSGMFEAVLRENSQRDQVTELRNKLGLDDVL